MPELPEVEVVRRGLQHHVVGRSIEVVEVLHERPLRRHLAGPVDFADRLTGRIIDAVHRRGKYFWLALDDGNALLGHLGMSGQMLVQPRETPAERHLRVRFELSEGPDCERHPVELRYVDQRMFGGLLVSTGGADLPAEITHIARDPLDPEFDDDEFSRRVRAKKSGIKRILLDQSTIAGVGNIYADEALWLTGVHGDRAGEKLTRVQVRALLDSVRAVMRAALEQGGTSFDSLYVNVNGESGYFDRSLNAYGREGKPCSRCGTPISRIVFMNRSSFFCPRCQRKR
ncbi:MAG: bifunctional DNA-formamidopyrimidine glycosylase/DNA-(apurinic or apyrimidinic site) lyase [Nocardioidaceae bacterium]|nr:MAG: bifunctional DNA-formamidopyrimidine glycosylase/DNA-(apurinic or apyrimidinic site) lyase [Nocardioidaceae bacterium]